MLELTWDSRDLEFWRNRKTEAALLRAASKAGGDALRSLKTAGVKVVRERKRFKAARVNKAMPLFYPRGERDLTSLVWRMDVSGKPVPLVDLPHSQTKRGVSVAVNAGGRKLLRSAFLATMKSGHEGIFRRVGSSQAPDQRGVHHSRVGRVQRPGRDPGGARSGGAEIPERLPPAPAART
jgi:hypothetical protein